MWLKVILFVVIGLVIIISGLIAYGSYRWKTSTDKLHSNLDAARLSIQPTKYDARETEDLPAPVRRYFRTVLKDGQPMISVARFEQEGLLNMGETEAKWSRFTASQLVVIKRPGFDWNARINMAPAMNALVHDAYVAGEGILHVELLGLIPLADLRGTPEMAQGELMRYLAEAVWYPTALLPSQGVRWEAINDTSARATLVDDDNTVSLVFHFNAEGLINAVRAEARYRTVNGELIPTPWLGRFENYKTESDIYIPFEGEVAWELPENLWPYWQGRITRISYEFTQPKLEKSD